MNQKSIIGTQKAQSTLVRPQYSPGLLLNDDDLSQAVDYTRDLNRMLFRALLGCGVVCGLVVKAVKSTGTCGALQVSVDPGLALDCHGDPLHLPGTCTVNIDPCVVLSSPLWVMARRYDKHCAPRGTECSPCDDATTVCTRIRDSIEIAVVNALPGCSCGCTEAAPATSAETDATKDGASGAAKTKPAAAAAGATDGGGKSKAAAATPAPTPGSSGQPAASSPDDPCYKDHYAGTCAVCCNDCACEWVLLARLTSSTDGSWKPDHSVRRFIRPLLLADPQPALDKAANS
ncbi:hypothetical protein Jab_2c06890 [Janthinobacterium sp. HH01]|uniref:hypothetical protein n=1 Tax=Janthinobacterium sp. HH01 TaxID=1198452 RepID=UPI0002AEDCCF|nr:hypothetical protein [Janthinobacterium sp. HH01]ELX08634.1 hypothetical protein Jab_2c06890 [Janthinobacterium sp. HH01]